LWLVVLSKLWLFVLWLSVRIPLKRSTWLWCYFSDKQTDDHTFTMYFVSIVLPEIIMSHSSIVFHNHRFYKAKKKKKKNQNIDETRVPQFTFFFKYNRKSYWWPFSFLAHLNSFACSTVNTKNSFFQLTQYQEILFCISKTSCYSPVWKKIAFYYIIKRKFKQWWSTNFTNINKKNPKYNDLSSLPSACINQSVSILK
jgi:hypothetical protein